jgi:hypothetical protein
VTTDTKSGQNAPSRAAFVNGPRLRDIAWFLLATILLAAGPCTAQEPPASTHIDGAEVRLETPDGRTQFTLAEPLPLELVFSAHASGFEVNTTNYGDMSEDVNVSPGDGWFRSHAASRHDYLTSTPLEDEPIRIPVLLNQGIVFLKPGRYEVSITTSRLMGPQSAGRIRLTTNTVTLDLMPMDEQQEAALVRSLSGQIATASGSPQQQAAQQLAYLPGDEAVRAKVRWFLDSFSGANESLEKQMLEGFASSRNLKLQLDLLEAAWLDPQRTPQSSLLDAMQQTRAFLRHQTLNGWSMVSVPIAEDAPNTAEQERRADISKIVATLPQRTGENRRDTAYYLMEFNGLSDAEKELVRPAVLSEFAQMEPLAQSMLLETRWKDLRDPSLVPALEAMLDGPVDGFSHRDALQRLIELAPETAKPYALREICDPQSEVLVEQLADLPDATLPEADQCLLTELSSSTSRHNPQWHWKAMIAARFASESLLPAMRKMYFGREDWNPQADEGAFLAYLLRYAPQEAVASLDTLGVNAQGTFFYIDKVFEARKAVFPAPLEDWLHEKLTKGGADEAGVAAYELSRFGKAEDKALVEARLEQLRQQWREGGSGSAAGSAVRSEAEAHKLEVDLMSTLASGDSKAWTMTREEAVRLGEDCLTSECKRYAPAVP